MAEPESKSLMKFNIPAILVKGGGGAVAGYATDYAEEKFAVPAINSNPQLAFLTQQVTTVNGVVVTNLDMLTYGVGVAALIVPSVFGRHDLTLTGLGFLGGKAYRKYGASYGLPVPV